MKESKDAELPDRETLARDGITLIRNGGCYEEYTLQGARFGCGWNGIHHRWVTRRLAPRKH